MEDLLTLSDKHFEMILRPKSFKIKRDNLDNMNNNENLSLPSFPIRIPISVGVEDSLLEYVGQIE